MRKLELLLFVIIRNIKGKFIVDGIIKKGIVLGLFMVIVIFNGAISGKGIQLLITNQIFSKEYLTIGFSVLLGLMIVIKDIFPSPKSIYYIDNSYYPIYTLDHYLLSKTKEFSNAHTFLILLFSTTTYLLSGVYSAVEYFQLYFVILFFKGLNYSFRMFFFNKLNLLTLLYLISCLSNLVSYIYFDIDVIYFFVGALIQTFLGFYGFKIFFKTKDIKLQIDSHKKYYQKIFLLSTKYFYSDEKIKTNIITFILFKIILLTVVSIGGAGFFSSWQYFAKLMVLPILPFTYIINNILGYTTPLYRNICLSEKIKFNLLLSYFVPVLSLIIIDFLTSFIILYLSKIDLFAEIFKVQIIDLTLSYYTAYLCSIIFFLNVSIYFSLFKYKAILKTVVQKTTTNFLGSIIIILIASSIIILLEQNNGIILLLSILFISLTFYVLLMKNIKGLKSNLTSNFLK